MNKSQIMNRLLVILLVLLLVFVFAACNTINKKEPVQDPLTQFHNEVLKQDPDIIDSKLTMTDDTVECTIEVKEAATNEFANQIGKDHAEQLAKRLPGKTIKMKIMKNGNIIGDFSTKK